MTLNTIVTGIVCGQSVDRGALDVDAPEERRGSDRTPEERLDHGWRLIGWRAGTRAVVLREQSGPWSRLTQR